VVEQVVLVAGELEELLQMVQQELLTQVVEAVVEVAVRQQAEQVVPVLSS
jgi:hypothetical protein